MSDAHNRMAQDLAQKIIGDLQPRLEREMKIALAGGLPPGEMILMMTIVAASLNAAVAVMATEVRRPGVPREALYDLVSGLIESATKELRDPALENLAQELARRAG